MTLVLDADKNICGPEAMKKADAEHDGKRLFGGIYTDSDSSQT